jgi:hypothetical protein
MVRELQEAYEKRGVIINKNKCDYMIFGGNKKDDLLLEGDYVRRVGKCKYFGFLLNKNGNSNEEISNRVNKGRNITRSLNSVSWRKLEKDNKEKNVQNYGTARYVI